MKKLITGEIYNNTFKQNLDSQNANNQLISQNLGVISPQHIEAALVDLKSRTKSQYSAFLNEAIALFENRGLIKLFNLSSAGGGRSRIPTSMPFMPIVARNRVRELDSSFNGKEPVMCVNMYKIGNWTDNETLYKGVSPLDLATCLESGLVAYKIVIQHMAENVFSDKNVLEYLTKIYTYMFAQAMIKTKVGFGGSDFSNDSAHFLIAKFFLLYVLEKQDSPIVDDYAYLAVKNKSSMESLKSFEEMSGIDYTSLTGFLKTFGETFYNGEPVLLLNFETKWVSLFGDGTGLAIEYAPYLIHFLLAALRGSILGGSSRLTRYKAELTKLGLPRLYNALANALR